MPASAMDRVRDPLTETFKLGDLPQIAPWIYEEIEAADHEALEEAGIDLQEAHSMQEWVAAISHSHSEMWQALQAQG